MIAFLVQRAAESLVSILLLTLIVFGLLLATPGDPAVALMGQAAGDPRNAEMLEDLRRELGIDQPVWIQYGKWFANVIQGDLGVSVRSGASVADLIAGRLPATLQLLVVSIVVSLVISIPLGVWAATTPRRWVDRTLIFLSVAGVAVPGFWLGLVLILIFSVQLGWLPPSGYTPVWEDPISNLQRSIMPVATLSVYLIATFTRFLRSDLLEVMGEDYVRTARAKGMNHRRVIWKHAFRNALPSLWTVIGIEAGTLLGGVIIVEVVFGWSGIGWLAVQAVNNRDYALVQGVVLFTAVGFAAITLLTDLGYAFLDPRVRRSS